MEYINTRIKKEICFETLKEFTDAKLMRQYMDCNSVKNEIKKLSNVLEKYTDEETKQKIIQDYLLQLHLYKVNVDIRSFTFNMKTKYIKCKPGFYDSKFVSI